NVNGIATQLKTHFPFLTKHHCISYRLVLASKDAAELTPYFETYDKIIRQLYSYFIISALLEDATKGQKTAQQLYNTDYVSVSEVTIQVNTVIEFITADFIGKANIQPTFGTILLRFMNQQNILPHDFPLFV
ncbi:14885_t:CDS:2, partial [Dentiscutata heterogama]